MILSTAYLPQLTGEREQEEMKQQLASAAIREKSLQEQLRQNQQQIDQLQLQLQQEQQSSQKLQEQLQQEQQSTQNLQEQLQEERQSTQNLQEQLQEERQSTQNLQEQLQQERQSTQNLQEQLQEERQSTQNLQEQLQEERQSTQNLQEQLQEEQQSSQKLQEQLQKEWQSTQNLQEQLQQERQSSQNLQEQLQQSNQRLQELLQQDQQSNQHLRQQLQQEQQRSRSLQERVDRSAGEMESMCPVTVVSMNVEFCTAQRSEVQTEATIGEGAWGKVESGVFRGSPVAVKSIHPAILKDDTVQRLRREITIVAQVRHPNLVHFIAAVLDDTAHAPLMIITELLDINLRKAYEEKVVDPSHHLSILRDIAYGLHHIHSLQEPIIHRDVSSPNVLLQQQPNGGWLAKVSDFGSANFAKDARTAGEGAIIYSAPESFPATVSDPDSKPPLLTVKVDVYSYGVVACELVTGQMPSSERYRAMLQEVQREWVLMHGLITRCTKRDPFHRPTMANILDELPRTRPIP